jgi:hypothetical protein
VRSPFAALITFPAQQKKPKASLYLSTVPRTHLGRDSGSCPIPKRVSLSLFGWFVGSKEPRGRLTLELMVDSSNSESTLQLFESE